jgi:hypothetical protein
MNPETFRADWGCLVRSLARAIAVGALSLASGAVQGQGAAEPAASAKPKVYALVAAVGANFHVAVEGRRTGSRLDSYNRKTFDAPDNLLNRVVLQALDKEIAQARPEGQRVYFSLSAPRLDRVPAAERDQVAIARVIEELRGMPQRADWERIVVATPAYKAFAANGLADKLQGLGISMHPMQSNLTMFFDLPAFADSARGDDALTPGGKPVTTEIFLAPYSYLTIWVLDPGTLAVLDRQERFDSQKLANPGSGSSDLVESVGKDFIARQIVVLIGRSVHEAVSRTELAGKVDIRDVREVRPGEAGK